MTTDEEKAKKAAYAKEWYAKNREKQLAYSKQYRKDNPEKWKETKRKHREKNKDAIAEYSRQYMEANRDTLIEKKREKRKCPIEKQKQSEYNKKYRTENDEVIRKKRKDAWSDPEKRCASHITVIRGKYPDCFSHDGSEDPEQMGLWFLSSREGRCKYCGAEENTHVDHIHPLSRGGKHSWDNIQMICKTCNIAKHNLFEHEFFAWIENLKRHIGAATT